MKKAVFLLAVLFSVVLFFNCGGGNDPKDVADKFAKAYLIDHDVNEYTKYLDSKTKESLLDPVMKDYHKQQQEAVKNLKLKYQIDKEKSLVNQSGASIYFNITSDTDPVYKKSARVDLKQDLDGKWFINYYTFPTRF